GHTTTRFRGLDQAPPYLSPTLTDQLVHAYGFPSGQQVSLLPQGGRVIRSYTGLDRHVALIQQGARIGTAKRWYDKPRQQVDLLVSLQIVVADPVPKTTQRLVGVDGGQRYLAVATDMRNRRQCYPGKAVRGAIADHYARLRKRVQSKGTRSASKRMS